MYSHTVWETRHPEFGVDWEQLRRPVGIRTIGQRSQEEKRSHEQIWRRKTRFYLKFTSTHPLGTGARETQPHGNHNGVEFARVRQYFVGLCGLGKKRYQRRETEE